MVVHGVAHQTGRINQGLRPLAPWLPDRSYLVRITRHSITGRVLGSRPAELTQP